MYSLTQTVSEISQNNQQATQFKKNNALIESK
jgi:hypothetical protein